MGRWDALKEATKPTRFGPDSQLPRCQAKKRGDGQPCTQPAIKGKTVCRFHGGLGGRGKKRSAEERSEFYQKYRLPRRLKHEQRKAVEEQPYDHEARVWLLNSHPDLAEVKAAANVALKAYQEYQGGKIGVMDFQARMRIAASLI